MVMKLIKETVRQDTTRRILKEALQLPNDLIAQQVNEYLFSLDNFLLALENYIEDRNFILSSQISNTSSIENSQKVGVYIKDSLKATIANMKNCKRYMDICK